MRHGITFNLGSRDLLLGRRIPFPLRTVSMQGEDLQRATNETGEIVASFAPPTTPSVISAQDIVAMKVSQFQKDRNEQAGIVRIQA